MFDPQKHGTLQMETFVINSTTHDIQTIPSRSTISQSGIASLPGLNDYEKRYVQNNMIILPWNLEKYGVYVDSDPSVTWTYDASITFTYLKNNYFRFIYLHEIASKDQQSLPFNTNRIDQRNEWMQQSRNFTSNCLGWDATCWNSDWDPNKPSDQQLLCFKTLEELYNPNNEHLPAQDYNTNNADLHQLLLY